jgi:hypothetical protein
MKVIWDVDARTASVEAAIDKARRFESLLLICHYCSLQTVEMVAKQQLNTYISSVHCVE